MTKKDQKLEALYHYFISNGFDHTIEEIAQGIGVTKKTLFNRYENREGMEKSVMDHWHQVLLSRFYNKCQFCNNAIEKIVIFVCEIKLSYHNETQFFTKNFAQKPITISAIFSKTLYEIIQEG
ncbi:MAG: TetR/AcrR family transcriptional regulator, partial [Bacteroidales bacterium]